MPAPTHGNHPSLRVGVDRARQVDALAREAGLKRSELLRLLVAQPAEDDIPEKLLDLAADLRCADAPAITGEVPPKPLLTVREAAKMLRISTTTAYEWLRRGDLPGAVLLGGRWYVRRAVLERFIQGE